MYGATCAEHFYKKQDLKYVLKKISPKTNQDKNRYIRKTIIIQFLFSIKI